MKYVLFLTLSLILLPIHAQQNYSFDKERNLINKRLMTGLGSWASVNLISGGIGWASSQNETWKSFHQMNFFWNTVNLGLAIPGYFSARNFDDTLSVEKSFKEQHKTELLFAINSGLDLIYISSGFLLLNEAQKNKEKVEQFTGFGRSIIVQGTGLLIYDLIAYQLHRQHRVKKLNSSKNKVSVYPSAIGVSIRLSL